MYDFCTMLMDEIRVKQSFIESRLNTNRVDKNFRSKASIETLVSEPYMMFIFLDISYPQQLASRRNNGLVGAISTSISENSCCNEITSVSNKQLDENFVTRSKGIELE